MPNSGHEAERLKPNSVAYLHAVSSPTSKFSLKGIRNFELKRLKGGAV